MITSPSNPRIKNVIKLRDRRPRKQQGRFLIDGRRLVERALAAGVVIYELYLPATDSLTDDTERILEAARTARVEILDVSQPVFAKIAYGDHDEGMVAVAETPSYNLDELSLPNDALVIVVEGLEKPGNLGAILRTADAAGCDALLVADAVTEITNPNVVRASTGALFTVPIAQADSGEVLAWLRGRGFNVLAAKVDGGIGYASASYRGAVAIVLGSEAEGLSPIWQGDPIQAVRLPMHGAVDSLNVSVTAAVLLYEAQRQRRC